MITYQDYEKARDKTKWLQSAINKYRGSAEYKAAVIEEAYMAGRNTAIMQTMRIIYNAMGQPQENYTASNTKIRNRLIHRLVTDRCSYSLGNGVSFTGKKKGKNAEGKTVTIDPTKEELGDDFDNAVFKWGYWALANGAAFLYVHIGHDTEEWEYNLFKKSEFLALYDEKTGALRGGIRFWSLEWGKRPINAVLYTETGYTKYETPEDRYSVSALVEVEKEKPYTETVEISEAYGEEIVEDEGTTLLPIFPLYSGENRDSALDNLKPLIDSYDMILSGFANDLNDCAQIYWLISGGMGMKEKDKEALRDRLLIQHMAVIDGENSSITPYTQEPPFNAREAALAQLRNQMYENYGGFDVHTVEAGATNDHIEAAYWPMDEEADAFENQLTIAIRQILSMMEIDEIPLYTRNRVSNQKEQTDMILAALGQQAIDQQAALEKLPWITVDEVDEILARLDAGIDSRLDTDDTDDTDDGDDDNPDDSAAEDDKKKKPEKDSEE